jgi:hypothetical protein
VEFYDLVGDPQAEDYRRVMTRLSGMAQSYEDIPELPVGEAWYDKYLNVAMHKQLKDDARNEALFCDALGAYLDASRDVEHSSAEDAAKQLQITQDYADALIKNGGVSTDVFKKALGEETTQDFFNKVFFGTELYAQAQ